MTKPRDPEALLSAYLVDGMEVLPDRVADAVLHEIHRTRQRAVPASWRTRSMFQPSLAVAAVVAVLVAGTLLATRRDQPVVGNPTAGVPGIVAPSSTPSATPPNASAVTRSTGIWVATGSMGTPRYGHTAVRLLDGRVLVVGGATGHPSGSSWVADLTSAELYDPATGTWSATGNMLKPHLGFPATLLRDGKVLVGDVDDPTADPAVKDPIPGAEVYDPATGTWSSTGKLANALAAHVGYMAGTTATLLPDGRVLAAGDYGAQLYDPVSGTWSATGRMVTPRHNHTATLMPDGKVLVAGGDVGDTMEYSAELYDPDTGSWTAIANTRDGGRCRTGCPRGGGLATLLQDGTLFFMRASSSTPIIEFVEIYDPATGRWTPTGDMARPDAVYSAATRLLDGTVLVSGGQSGKDVRGLAEVYDPATGSWTETGHMLHDMFHRPSSATLLLDGTVLVAGGFALSCCDATSSAELHIPAGVSLPDLGPFPSPTPTPIPTPSPTPTPIPTPFPPAAGPVPPGARPWQVTVVNKSANPATLFVADENEQGLLGRLVGSATPNVVPPGATVKVTFLLPAKGVEGWSIFVNPGPNDGPLLLWDQVPLEGTIYIDAAGQVMWG